MQREQPVQVWGALPGQAPGHGALGRGNHLIPLVLPTNQLTGAVLVLASFKSLYHIFLWMSAFRINCLFVSVCIDRSFSLLKRSAILKKRGVGFTNAKQSLAVADTPLLDVSYVAKITYLANANPYILMRRLSLNERSCCVGSQRRKSIPTTSHWPSGPDCPRWNSGMWLHFFTLNPIANFLYTKKPTVIMCLSHESLTETCIHGLFSR